MFVNAINDRCLWTDCASRNLFWTTKIAFQIQAHHLSLLNVSIDSVTMGLTKRLPVRLVREWFKNKTINIGGSADYRAFNSMRIGLGTAVGCSTFAKLLPSFKTMGAVITTLCTQTFRPYPTTWAKASANARSHCELRKLQCHDATLASESEQATELNKRPLVPPLS